MPCTSSNHPVSRYYTFLHGLKILDSQDRDDMLGAWLDRVDEDAQLPECDTTFDME